MYIVHYQLILENNLVIVYNIKMVLGIKGLSRLGVAVSGGRDSMALLHMLIEELSPDSLLVINIEHGIRGEKSREESRFVMEHCKEWGVPAVSIALDVLSYARENKLTTEQAARELRYREFNRLIDEGQVNKVALAHHKGDQAETLMMRILRGTGISGLAGMSADGERFIRPILHMTRKEINSYIKHNAIPYVDDDSNKDNDYSRNFIRNEVFPLISKKFGDYENALIRLSDNAREDNDYIMSQVVRPELLGGAAVLPVSVLNTHRSLAVRSIMLCFNMLGITQDIERRHMDVLLDMHALESGRGLDMPYGVRVYKEYDNLVFVRLEAPMSAEVAPFKAGLTTLGEKKITVAPYEGKGLKFDYDKIPINAVIRFRREGDNFLKFGGGSKSLGDYLTDIKIPRRIRDNIPLIALGSDVLVIAGIEISESVKIEKETKNIYTIYIGD